MVHMGIGGRPCNGPLIVLKRAVGEPQTAASSHVRPIVLTMTFRRHMTGALMGWTIATYLQQQQAVVEEK